MAVGRGVKKMKTKTDQEPKRQEKRHQKAHLHSKGREGNIWRTTQIAARGGRPRKAVGNFKRALGTPSSDFRECDTGDTDFLYAAITWN